MCSHRYEVEGWRRSKASDVWVAGGADRAMRSAIAGENSGNPGLGLPVSVLPDCLAVNRSARGRR